MVAPGKPEDNRSQIQDHDWKGDRDKGQDCDRVERVCEVTLEVMKLLGEDQRPEESRVVETNDAEVPADCQTRHEPVTVSALSPCLRKALVFDHFAAVGTADEEVTQEKEEQHDPADHPHHSASEDQSLGDLEGD